MNFTLESYKKLEDPVRENIKILSNIKLDRGLNWTIS